MNVKKDPHIRGYDCNKRKLKVKGKGNEVSRKVPTFVILSQLLARSLFQQVYVIFVTRRPHHMYKKFRINNIE